MRFHLVLSMAVLGLCWIGAEAQGDEGRPSAKSRLSPPEGAPFPDARGQAHLNPNHFMVKVQGLGLPFDAGQPADLGGRAICVNDSAGTTVLEGTTPMVAADATPDGLYCSETN